MPLSFAGAPFPPDPARLSTANTFTNNQTVIGNISADGSFNTITSNGSTAVGRSNTASGNNSSAVNCSFGNDDAFLSSVNF